MNKLAIALLGALVLTPPVFAEEGIVPYPAQETATLRLLREAAPATYLPDGTLVPYPATMSAELWLARQAAPATYPDRLN